MKIYLYGALALVWLMVVPMAALSETEPVDREIAYLLDTISRSNCRFIRNGIAYSAVEAREHMEKKYDYARSRIKSAEAFIRYVATKSSMTGEPYLIECDGQTMPCADWLQDALARFRQNGDGVGNGRP